MTNPVDRHSRRIELSTVSKADKSKKFETSDLLITRSLDDHMMISGKKSSFSRMMFDIG